MRLIKVSQDPRDLTWEQALEQLQQDDVLMLAPGFYEIPSGQDLNNIVIKGTGSAPEMTNLIGQIELTGRYLTLENLTLKGREAAGTLMTAASGENAPYLTLRGCGLEAAGGEKGTALKTQGSVWLELYSCQLKGKIQLAGGEQHVQIAGSEIAADPVALAAAGYGPLAISRSRIRGEVALQEASAYEGHFDQTAFDQVTSRGQADDLYFTESALALAGQLGQVDLLNCELKGSTDLQQVDQASFQNCTFDQLTQTGGSSFLTNCHLRAGEVKGAGKATFCRPHFSCDEGKWLDLADSAQVRLQDALLNVAGSQLALAGQAGILGSVLESDQEVLPVKQAGQGKVKLTGIKCKLV